MATAAQLNTFADEILSVARLLEASRGCGGR